MGHPVYNQSKQQKPDQVGKIMSRQWYYLSVDGNDNLCRIVFLEAQLNTRYHFHCQSHPGPLSGHCCTASRYVKTNNLQKKTLVSPYNNNESRTSKYIIIYLHFILLLITTPKFFQYEILPPRLSQCCSSSSSLYLCFPLLRAVMTGPIRFSRPAPVLLAKLQYACPYAALSALAEVVCNKERSSQLQLASVSFSQLQLVLVVM